MSIDKHDNWHYYGGLVLSFMHNIPQNHNNTNIIELFWAFNSVPPSLFKSLLCQPWHRSMNTLTSGTKNLTIKTVINNHTIYFGVKSTCFCLCQRWLNNNMHGDDPRRKLTKRYSTLAHRLVVLQNFASIYELNIICCPWYNFLVWTKDTFYKW